MKSLKSDIHSKKVTDILSEAHEHLQQKDAVREHALSGSRQVIRFCAEATRTIHREEFEAAEELLSRARGILTEMKGMMGKHPDVLYSGFVGDAEKEYAEGMVALATVKGDEIPSPEELEVDTAPYLNGIAEAIGELRRRIVDNLRTGEVEECIQLLETMDIFYSGIVSFDYPEAMLLGLRRRTDAARSIIERTRHDVAHAIRQDRLEATMKRLESRLEESGGAGAPSTDGKSEEV